MTVLNTIKKTLGIPAADDSFDIDIVMYINTSINYLFQMGLDSKKLKSSIDEETTWEELLGKDDSLSLIKTYISMSVRTMFDPPSSSILAEAYKRNMKELEWRITNISLHD